MDACRASRHSCAPSPARYSACPPHGAQAPSRGSDRLAAAAPTLRRWEELALRGGLFGPAQDAAAAPVRRLERHLSASRAPRREALFGPRHRCLCEKNPMLWRVRVSEFVSPHARDGSLSYTGAWDVRRRLFLRVLSYVKNSQNNGRHPLVIPCSVACWDYSTLKIFLNK